MPPGSKRRKVDDIEYFLLPGVKRKTTDIVIERDGSICVRPPTGLTPEQVDQTVFSKRMWIYRNKEQWHQLNGRRVQREWVDGETFLYLGRHFLLSLVDDQSVSLMLKQGRFCLQRSSSKQRCAEQAFSRFYAEKGVNWIQQRVDFYAPKVGVAVGDVQVKEIGFKWAARKPNGNLDFHWKCMMAPLKIIDYIVVHELCHHYYQDHSDAFWNEVDKVMSDYRVRKEWLRVNGAALSL